MTKHVTHSLGGIYYGWKMLFAVSFTEMVSWGVLYYAFPVFLKPMQATLGWSTASLTGAFSLALLCSGIAALPAGRWLDRHGTRTLMTLGSIMATLLVLAWATVANLAIFYLIWIALGLTMAAVLYDPAFVLVATWFHHQRARALTILTFIAGFASVIFVPLAQWLVQVQGWRAALVTLALMLGLTTIPLHALILRRRPQDLGLMPDGITNSLIPSAPIKVPDRRTPLRDALHHPTFWGISGAFGLAMLAASALTVHLIPFLLDQGYPPGFAAGAVGLVGIMALPGRLVFTLLGERFPRRYVTALLFLFQAMAPAALLILPHVSGVAIFVVLFGAGFGAMSPARAALIAEVYGTTYYARINSIVGLFITGARAVAPIGVGILVDRLGYYQPIFWGMTVVSLLAAGIMLLTDATG